MFDTVTAIATGKTNQAISIIRVSGDDAFSIVEKIFSGSTGKANTFTYGFIIDGKKNIDEVLVA
jgi:tRNA modification GTPase